MAVSHVCSSDYCDPRTPEGNLAAFPESDIKTRTSKATPEAAMNARSLKFDIFAGTDASEFL